MRLSGNNSDAAFIAASGNADAQAQYNYALADVTHHSDLPHGFGFNLNLAGQLSSSSLPGIEQFGVGGADSVRGYQSGEISGDSGFTVQAELRLPTIPLSQKDGLQGDISFYGFADFGEAYSHTTETSQSLFGAGIGMDININNNVHATLIWGHAFDAGPTTLADSDRVHFSLVASY